MPILYRLIVLTSLFLLSKTAKLSAQTSWTGNINTAWNTAGNWTNGVPTGSVEAIIPDVSNDPVISMAGAVAQSVTVQAGGLLTIQADGVLTINGAAGHGLFNQGVVQNNGTIHIGNISTTGLNALRNDGQFFNNHGSVINLDRAVGLQSVTLNNGGAFTNSGAIRIGGIAASGTYGIDNNGSFQNNSSGEIFIDRITGFGIRNHAPFSNSGLINIGSINSETQINIGITNTQTTDAFVNASGGRLIINRVNTGINAANFGIIPNAGTISIGQTGNVTTIVSGNQTGKLSNDAGGIFEVNGNLLTERIINNGGTLSPGYAASALPVGWISFNNHTDLGNGILAIDVRGAGEAGVDYDQVGINGNATIGGTLALNFNYVGIAGDRITVLTSSSSLSGTFNTVTGLPDGWVLSYTSTDVILTYGTMPDLNTWTGNVNSNWSNGANWSQGVPDASHNVIIPNVANDPIISSSDAIARSVRIESGALLTISEAGSLSINGSEIDGLVNNGTVENSGILRIGDSSGLSGYGITNNGNFVNNSGAEIHIDRTPAGAIYGQSGGLNNYGMIYIGALSAVTNLVAAAGEGTIINNTGAEFLGKGSISSQRFVNAGGRLSTGNTTGIINFGDGEDFSSSTIVIKINRAGTAGTNYDQVISTGTAVLGGALVLDINYTPQVGDRFTILEAPIVSGSFSHIADLPASWTVSYFENSVVLTYGQIEWWGLINADWHTPGNWSYGIVPRADQEVMITDTGHAPVISAAAVAKFINIQPGASLTITASGHLSVNGAVYEGIFNAGTLDNSGRIDIGNSSSTGIYGLRNINTFTNREGGIIRIDRSGGPQSNPLLNRGSISNAGTINIGSLAVSGSYGISNSGIFTNADGGEITIDRVSIGIRDAASMTNHGIIRIGSLPVNNTMHSGITNSSNSNNFNNAAGGRLFIDRTIDEALSTSSYGQMLNAGTITIGSVAPVARLLVGRLSGTLVNLAGASIIGSGDIPSSRLVHAGGSISPGNPAGIISFVGPVDFANAVLEIKVNGISAPGTDYDLLSVNGTVSLGGTLNLKITHSGVMGDEITIITGTNITGTFSTVTGDEGWSLNYYPDRVTLASGTSKTSTWTGAASTDWNDNANWSDGVPADGDIVIIPDVTNNPVISVTTAAASLITIEAGGVLTIAANGRLTLNGLGPQNLLNQGTVMNNGSLIIGNERLSGTNGIRNENEFTNNAGASIHIDSTGAGVAVNNIGNFTNSGTIITGAAASTGFYGISNSSTFNNNTGAEIFINRVAEAALRNSNVAVFINSGSITVGTNAGIGRYGIINQGDFDNTAEGLIQINCANTTALFNSANRFSNAGTIRIGTDAIAGIDGIGNNGSFENLSNGSVTIDRVINAGIYNNGDEFINSGIISIGSLNAGSTINWGIYNDKNFSNDNGNINLDRVNLAITVSQQEFHNSGRINVGFESNVPTILNSAGTGLFNNNLGGLISGTGTIDAARYNHAGGALAPGASRGIITISGNEDLSNGKLIVNAKAAGIAGSDYDQFVINGTVSLGGSLEVSINYSAVADDRLTILKATAVSGTFSTVTGLSEGWEIQYSSEEVILQFEDNRNRWTGSISPSWNTAGNWSKNQVPGGEQSVLLPADGVIRELTINSALSIGSIEISGGRRVILGASGSLTVINDIINKGTIAGNGILRNASFMNEGTLAPGASAGLLNIDGNLISAGTIEIEIAGTSAENYDRLAVSGDFTAGGILSVRAIEGFSFQPGQTFTIITAGSIDGNFSEVIWPEGVSGTVTFSGDQVILNILSVLPLTLVEFTASDHSGKVQLNWATEMEVNTASFEIERSNNGVDFSRIGSVSSVGSGANRYSFIDDREGLGLRFYRLKMIDIDGRFTYSEVISRKPGQRSGISISPVPARSFIIVSRKTTSETNQRASIIDMSGRRILQVQLTGINHRIDISSLLPGIYLIETKEGIYRFIKQ